MSCRHHPHLTCMLQPFHTSHNFQFCTRLFTNASLEHYSACIKVHDIVDEESLRFNSESKHIKSEIPWTAARYWHQRGRSTNAPFLSLVMDEQRMRSGYWLCWGLIQSPSCHCGQRQTIKPHCWYVPCPIIKIWSRTESKSTMWMMTQSYGWNQLWLQHSPRNENELAAVSTLKCLQCFHSLL